MTEQRRRRVKLNTVESLVIDDHVFEEMEVLEQLIDYHKREYQGLDGRYGELKMPISPEIQHIINREVLQNEWNMRQYDQVRILWAESWMIYYQSLFDMEPSYTAEEYAHQSKTQHS